MQLVLVYTRSLLLTTWSNFALVHCVRVLNRCQLQAASDARNKEALALEGAVAELGAKLRASQQSADEMRALVARAETELERLRAQLKRSADELDAANALHARAVSILVCSFLHCTALLQRQRAPAPLTCASTHCTRIDPNLELNSTQCSRHPNYCLLAHACPPIMLHNSLIATPVY